MTPKQLNRLAALCATRTDLQTTLAETEAAIVTLTTPPKKARGTGKKTSKKPPAKPAAETKAKKAVAPKGEMSDKILAVFNGFEDGSVLTSAHVFEQLGMDESQKAKVSMALGYLAKKGILERQERGSFKLAAKEPAASDTAAAAE